MQFIMKISKENLIIEKARRSWDSTVETHAPQKKLVKHSMEYQMIMARSLPEEVTQGTLEGDIIPGDITFYVSRVQPMEKLRAYLAEGEVLPIATRSFGAIGIFAIKEMERFYRQCPWFEKIIRTMEQLCSVILENNY